MVRGLKLEQQLGQEKFQEFLADLGKMTDADVARKYDLFYRTPMIWRKKMNIKTFANERMPSKEELREDLEQMPNTKICEKYGVGLDLISVWRKKLGLSNVWKCQTRNTEEFIEDTKFMGWRDVCKKYNISRSDYGYWRLKLGLTDGKRHSRGVEYIVDGNGCWVPISHKNLIKDEDTTQKVRVARFVKEKVGECGEGIVLHSCDNSKCINPDHIRFGTHKENSEDAVDRDRSGWGNRSGARKLSSDQAKDIYALKNSGMPQRDVGKKFGVSGSTVFHIWHKKTWKRDNEDVKNFPVFLSKPCVGKKLTYDDVKSIRSFKGLQSQSNVADVFGVSQQLISKIWRDKIKIWNGVK